MTNFVSVANMNTAFGNPQGDPNNIDWGRIRSQCLNILDEFIELQAALGMNEASLNDLKLVRSTMGSTDYTESPDLEKVRDGLCDIHVFGYGAHHLMGIDADRDMRAVVAGVMTRFIKDENDEIMTIHRHAEKGVTKVYLEGDYPTRVLKSAENQPDAPKGKFLKSASYSDTVFYTPV